MKKVHRAGVIPYYINPTTNEVQMFFMKPSFFMFGGDSFQLAKGKIEDDETTEEAAYREAGEELGLLETNIISSHLLGVVLGRTTVYISKIKDPNAFDAPHFETSEVKWFTVEEFEAEGRELHIPVVQDAYNLILTLEEKE